MSVSNSKNVRTPARVARNAMLAGLLVAASTGLATAVVAPAAQAAAEFCCSGGLSASPSDPGLVTVTFTNIGGQLPGAVALTNPTGSVSVTVAPVLVAGHFDAQNNWVPATPSVTTAQFRLLPGQTAQASIAGTPLGAPYTNPVVALPNITPRAPRQTGNVVVVPSAQPGVRYVDGAGHAVSSGQLTLGVGQTLVIKAVATVPPLGKLVGQTSWSFSYVAPPPSQLTPAAPTSVGDNLVQIPAVSGYHYEVGGQTVSGTIHVPKGDLTVTAVSNSTTLELVGKTSWSFSYVAPTTSRVTPAAPTRTSGNLIEIPAVSGYHYEVAGQTVSGTTYVPKGGLTITAVSDSATLELVGKVSWPFDFATPPAPDEGSKKIAICHATVSETNPYESITISLAALRGDDGHAGHDGDIWPEATYQAADDFIVTVPAHNWTDATAKIYADNCEVEATTPPPSDGGDNGHHGGDGNGDHNGGNHGGGNTTPSPSNGNTGGVTGGGIKDTGSKTSSVPVTTSTHSQTKTPATGTKSAGTGLLVKADTGVNPADDPASITMIGGGSVLAGVIGGVVLLWRRPKHRA